MKKYINIIESLNTEPSKNNLWLQDGYLKYFGPNGWVKMKSDIVDTDVVHKTGDETIGGVKTFTNPIVIPEGDSPEEAVRLSQLNTTKDILQSNIDDKVDKVTGKSLILDTEINKLQSYPVLGTNTNKFLRGDGVLADVVVGSGGYAANLYLTNINSDITGYKTLSYTSDSNLTTVQGTSVNNSEVLIEEFAFPQSLDVTTIDSGSWKFNLDCKVSSTSGSTFARIKVYKRSITNTETLLFETTSMNVNSTTDTRVVFESIQPIFTCNTTDRLVIKLYVTTTSNANRSLIVNIGGENASYFNTPLSIRHSQLRDLNEDANVQHMTTGEKFAIGGVARKTFGYKNVVNSNITIPANNLTNIENNSFTLEALFSPTSLNGTCHLISKESSWYIRIEYTATAILFTVYDSSDAVDYKAQYLNNLVVGKIYHVVCTILNNIPYIYVNGQLSGIGKSLDNKVITSNNITFIVNKKTSYDANPEIYLFRFFRRSFSQQDVDHYYNAGRPDLSRLSYVDKVNKTSTGCVLELLPENATQTKWLDTQNGLDGVTSGNPVINYGNVTPEPYVYPFKKYIGLEQNGDGTGFARFSVITNKTGKAIVSGGVFVDSTGSNEIGKELTLYKDIQTNIYVKLLSQFGDIEFDNLIYLSDFAKGNNDPIIAPFTSELPIKFGAYGTATTAVNKLYGSVSLIPRNVIDLRLSIPANVSGLTVGDYKELPRGIEYLFLNNTKISGDLSGIPRKVKVLYLGSSTGINGLIKDIPDSCVRLTLSGTNTVSGNLSDLKGAIELMTLYGINVTYSGNLKFNTSVDTIIISPTSNIFTSAMTDQILIDLAAQVTTAIGSKVINLIGSCGAPTSASSDARTYLSGLGFTVTTN